MWLRCGCASLSADALPQAIDEQVDLLAASAAKALGSLWGGLNSVAKQSLTVGAALTAKVRVGGRGFARTFVQTYVSCCLLVA